jgi:hypothetical protein
MSTPLEESIAHWEANYDAEDPDDAHTTAAHCPLCKVHLNYEDDVRCVGCPVREHTKLSGCADTPWSKADDALYDWASRLTSDKDKGKWLSACRDEINFLKSLRPTEGGG